VAWEAAKGGIAVVGHILLAHLGRSATFIYSTIRRVAIDPPTLPAAREISPRTPSRPFSPGLTEADRLNEPTHL
jgi:hypothetical protein